MDVEKLSSMITSLSDIHASLQILRNAPPLLLKSPMLFLSQPIRTDFQQLKELTETIRSDSIQDALRTAINCERSDRSDLDRNGRRESRKRRISPALYSIRKAQHVLLPMASGDCPPLRVDELPGYIRDFNQSHSSKLHIWNRIRDSTQLGSPAVVRFTIRDVLVCYITMAYTQGEPILVTESATAFGPREKKSPHSQSDFLVYQTLSQQIAKTLQSHPRISFQSLVNLMCAYEGLFIDRCTSCERVLSAEGHVPPVVRIWIETGKESDNGRWESRHASCPQT
ncbi:hypothetical protein B0H10DRAFT_2166729 [Mycena sp. CBHHK59/15]|nr:hypothetical protein B0H10DRAFT_2166729 [Mycena sp. CBHHK59/15]